MLDLDTRQLSLGEQRESDYEDDGDDGDAEVYCCLTLFLEREGRNLNTSLSHTQHLTGANRASSSSAGTIYVT